MNWLSLSTLDELDRIDQESHQTLCVLFKHSTRCGISRMALKMFEADHNFDQGSVKPYLLDLLNFRDVSNAIADRYKVEHQSPQIIILKQGKCLYTESHQSINVEAIKQFV